MNQITSTKNHAYLPMLAACLGFFMVIIDATIVNVALPSISRALNGSIANLQWVVDGYILACACLLLSAGNLTDRIGAKFTFLLGLSGFVVSSFGCGIANSFWLLTVSRLLQGLAGALLIPSSLAIVNSIHTDRQKRAKAIGIWGSIGGIAAACGPILGAVFTASFNWRAVFFVNIPIGLLAILLTIKSLKPTTKILKQHFDWPGQLSAIIAIAALAFGLIEAGKTGWLSTMTLTSLVIFTIAFIAFLYFEQHATLPMLPLVLFRSQKFSAATAIGMFFNLGFYGLLFLLPLYFQQFKNYSVLQTGFAILPQTVFVAIASYYGGKMASISGPKLPMIIGLTIGAMGFFTLLILHNHTAYLLLILPLAAIGFGTAFTMPATTIAVMHSVTDKQAGIAAGTLNTSRQLGSLIGVAVFGTIVNSSATFISGMHTALIIGGSLYLAGCLLAFLFINAK